MVVRLASANQTRFPPERECYTEEPIPRGSAIVPRRETEYEQIMSLTFNQKVEVWNTVGAWVAGLGTLAAVVTSLYLARHSESIRLKVWADVYHTYLGDGTPPEKSIIISVVNQGDRPVNIDTVGWAIGKGKRRRYCIQTVSGRSTQHYPMELGRRKRASFAISLVDTPDWATEFSNKFVESIKRRHLKTLVPQVHTSIGTTVEGKVGEKVIELIKEAWNEAE